MQLPLFDETAAERRKRIVDELQEFDRCILEHFVYYGDLSTMLDQFELLRDCKVKQVRDNWPELQGKTGDDVLAAIDCLEAEDLIKRDGGMIRRIPDATVNN